MPFTCRWSALVPALSATAALVLVAVAAGLPQWSISYEPGRATSVGLWAICQEAQSGWRCDPLPDAVSQHDNLGATRIAVVIAVVSAGLATLAAWVPVFSQRWVGAARTAALPLTLGAVVALGVGIGMWPGVHSAFWTSPGLSLGASFALICAAFGVELIALVGFVVSAVLARCTPKPPTFAPGDSEADEATEAKAVPDFTHYFAEFDVAKDAQWSARAAGVRVAPRWPLCVAIGATLGLLLAAILAAVAVALPDWSVQAAPGPKVQVGLWTICQEAGPAWRCDAHPDIVAQHAGTAATRIAAPMAVAFAFVAALLAALAVLLRRWMLGFGVAALTFSVGAFVALGVAIGSWTGVHTEFWHSPGLRPGASFALDCAALAVVVCSGAALLVAITTQKSLTDAQPNVFVVDYPAVAAKEADVALMPPVLGTPCVTPACV